MNLVINKRVPSPDISVIEIEGEIDVYTSAQLKQEIASSISDGTKFIVLNMAKVEYLDSTGLGLLIGALKRLRDADGGLCIVGPNTRIMRVFDITGLTGIFSIYGTEAEAAEKEGLSL